jgi:hypothetical protein
MKKQLLAVGFENYSNYIKLPESILIEFNKPKQSDILNNYNFIELKNKKKKGINLREQLAFKTDVNILPPYYFSVESSYSESQTKFAYCGVHEFTADEGMVLIPHGVLANLDVYDSPFVTIRYIGNVPKGDFVQLEPIQKEIFDIPELDKFFEKVISNYCLLYPEQIITCTYSDIEYSIKVKSIKSICEFDIEPELIDIVNTDLKIDIFNRFLEEELKEKARIEENARIEDEKKKKELDELKENTQLEKPTNRVFSGTGIKLGGGCETTDPLIIREIRLQRLLALQTLTEQSKPKPVFNSVQNNLIDLNESKINDMSNVNTISKSTPNKKSSKKSKDIEL